METSTKKNYMISVTKIEFTKRAGGNVREDFGDLEELKQSILINGIIKPITGYRDKAKAGHWLATDGHRRITAAKQLIAEKKVKDVEVQVMQFDERQKTDSEIIYSMLVSNSGKNLNHVEQAKAVKRLLDFGQTAKEISKTIGKSEQYVYQMQRLSGYSKPLQKMISNKEIAYTTCDKILTENGGDIEAMEQKIFSLQKEAKAITAVATGRVNELFETAETQEEPETPVNTGVSDQRKKITNKDLQQKNSFKELKSAIRDIEKKKLTIKNKELYETLKGIVNNEYEKAYLIALIGL